MLWLNSAKNGLSTEKVRELEVQIKKEPKDDVCAILEDSMLAGEAAIFYPSNEDDKKCFYVKLSCMAREYSKKHDFVGCAIKVLERRSGSWKEGDIDKEDVRLFYLLHSYYRAIAPLDTAFKGIDIALQYFQVCLKPHLGDWRGCNERETIMNLLEDYSFGLAKIGDSSLEPSQRLVIGMKKLFTDIPASKIFIYPEVRAMARILGVIYHDELKKMVIGTNMDVKIEGAGFSIRFSHTPWANPEKYILLDSGEIMGI
jgi:hypothetical protein